MSFLNHIENQVKSGVISKKDALDMKMNYLSLSKKEKEDLDNQYLDKRKKNLNKTSAPAKNKKTNTKANLTSFNKSSLVNFMRSVKPNDYELIFNSYYVFLKNKFSIDKEVEDIIEKAARQQLRGGESKEFYKEYINRKLKESPNYFKEKESEIKKTIKSLQNKPSSPNTNQYNSIDKPYSTTWTIIFIIIGLAFFAYKFDFIGSSSPPNSCKGDTNEVLECYNKRLNWLYNDIANDAKDGNMDESWLWSYSRIWNDKNTIVNYELKNKVNDLFIKFEHKTYNNFGSSMDALFFHFY